jgi:hypothetical protein
MENDVRVENVIGCFQIFSAVVVLLVTLGSILYMQKANEGAHRKLLSTFTVSKKATQPHTFISELLDVGTTNSFQLGLLAVLIASLMYLIILELLGLQTSCKRSNRSASIVTPLEASSDSAKSANENGEQTKLEAAQPLDWRFTKIRSLVGHIADRLAISFGIRCDLGQTCDSVAFKIKCAIISYLLQALQVAELGGILLYAYICEHLPGSTSQVYANAILRNTLRLQ